MIHGVTVAILALVYFISACIPLRALRLVTEFGLLRHVIRIHIVEE